MIQLRDNVYYVGVQNPTLRVFDIIMYTRYGTSYNSYLLKGEKYALIEAVHSSYTDVFLEQIQEITALSNISYIILNHTEPDHSGSLARLLEINPAIIVLGTAAAIKNLAAITNMNFKSQIVKAGDTLDLGNGMVLEFIIAPNLHWPDSMFTYLGKENILFSCDFLGTHFCEPLILDKYIKDQQIFEEEQRGYFNAIFAPFKSFVIEGLKKIDPLQIDMVCNSHGPILTTQVQATIDRYKQWSAPATSDKYGAVFYVSAYGYTRLLANTLAEELTQAGLPTKAYDIIKYDYSELAEIMNGSAAVLFGSPTINRDALKPVWDLISMTDAVGVKHKPALVFGSYGWSGEACQLLAERLRGLKYNLFNDGVRVLFKPTEADMENFKVIARDFLQTL